MGATLLSGLLIPIFFRKTKKFWETADRQVVRAQNLGVIKRVIEPSYASTFAKFDWDLSDYYLDCGYFFKIMKLDEIVPWGRSLAEYQLMFSLTEADLSRDILGCGDGPASFNAEMTDRG
jgi:hypothetical protein